MVTNSKIIQDQKKNHLAVLIVVILLIVTAAIFLSQAKTYAPVNQGSQIVNAPIAPTNDPNLWMKLESNNRSTQIAQSDKVILALTASSSGHDIVGYDALINYDPSFFDVVSIQSSSPDFQVVPFKKKGTISITGSKSPSVTSQTVFINQSLLTVVLSPKRKGTTTISLVPVSGPETTKMVDASSKLLTPQLTPITLAIY